VAIRPTASIRAHGLGEARYILSVIGGNATSGRARKEAGARRLPDVA